MEIRKRCDDIAFQHLIDLPNCDCVFCSARENKSGKTRLFLVFNSVEKYKTFPTTRKLLPTQHRRYDERSEEFSCEQVRIYIRNGIKDTWDELKDEYDYDQVREKFNSAIVERRIPCFTAATTDYNDVLRG